MSAIAPWQPQRRYSRQPLAPRWQRSAAVLCRQDVRWSHCCRMLSRFARSDRCRCCDCSIPVVVVCWGPMRRRCAHPDAKSGPDRWCMAARSDCDAPLRDSPAHVGRRCHTACRPAPPRTLPIEAAQAQDEHLSSMVAARCLQAELCAPWSSARRRTAPRPADLPLRSSVIRHAGASQRSRQQGHKHYRAQGVANQAFRRSPNSNQLLVSGAANRSDQTAALGQLIQ